MMAILTINHLCTSPQEKDSLTSSKCSLLPTVSMSTVPPKFCFLFHPFSSLSFFFVFGVSCSHVDVFCLCLVALQCIQSFGRFAMYVACREGFFSIAQMLVSTNKLDFSQRTKQGSTAFTVAAEHGRLDIVQLLISTKQVDVNILNKNKHTPLYLATLHTHINTHKPCLHWHCTHLITESLQTLNTLQSTPNQSKAVQTSPNPRPKRQQNNKTREECSLYEHV